MQVDVGIGPPATCGSGMSQTVGDVTCTVNANCFLSIDKKTLSVSLTAPPYEVAIGTVGGLQYPVIVIDMHTTNGSHHRYVVTYDGPRNPLTDPKIIAAVRDKLTPEAVNELLAGAREDEVFKLTDNILPHPTAEAWTVARNLTRSGYQPTSVAYRIARHLALVLEVRAKQDRGESLQSIQNDMSEHSFVVQKAYDAARSVQIDSLEAGLRAIRDYEWEVKSGQVDAELGLEVLLSRL